MATKQELKNLIEIIKTSTGLNQSEISTKAGYAEKYLSVQLSKGEVSDRVISTLKKTFTIGLENTTNILKESNPVYEVSRSEKDVLKDLLQLRALAKTLFHEVASLKAAKEGLTVQESTYRLNETTNQNLLALVR